MGRVSGQDGGDLREFAKHLYSSKAWKKCRASYLRSVGGLCERCLKKGLYVPAVIVHHKEWLTPDNINDPSVTMNFKNLEALCRECHEEEHAEGNKAAKHRSERRYTIDKDGKVTALADE